MASFSRDGDTFVWKFDNFIDAALVSVLEVKAENASIASPGNESQVIANIVKVKLPYSGGLIFGKDFIFKKKEFSF